jgi:hypothetical protein
MHICRKIRSDRGWDVRGGLAAGAAALLLLLMGGCASPGPPLPPSLKLPEVVTDLAATRVGDEVKLRWTTPSRTTDGVGVQGTITAEICRGVAANPAQRMGAQACSAVAKVTVRPGASEWGELLGAGMRDGRPRTLAYRVELRNASGRTAGPSAAAFAVSGAAPPPVEGLHGTATKGGAMLEWKAEGAPGDVIELDRTLVEAAFGEQEHKRAAKEPAEVKLRVSRDPGGTMDRTAWIGESYRYVAQRVRTVDVGGRSLEARSAVSASVTVAMLDVFPPNAPTGLVAAPGFAGDGQKPVIDLSWEPGLEARIAGYRVYRREGDGGEWQRLGSELVAMPAYRDLAVEAGRRYRYRVTAVDAAGNESGASGEIGETAPAR